jgi:hypothetical protein
MSDHDFQQRLRATGQVAAALRTESRQIAPRGFGPLPTGQ